MRGELLGADHEHGSPGPRRSSPSATPSRVHEPGAGRRRCRTRPPCRRRAAPAGRRRWTGSSRSGVTVASTMASSSSAVTPARLDRLPRPPAQSMASDWSGRGDAPLPDAGALDDPLVGGVEHLASGRRWSATRAGTAMPRLGHLGDRTARVMRVPRPRAAANSASMCCRGSAVDGLDRDPDRVLDGVGAGRAVTDDGHALHPEQRRAAVFRVVQKAEHPASPGAQHVGSLPLDDARRTAGRRTRRT